MNVIGIVQTVQAVDLAVVLMEPVVLQFIGHIDQDRIVEFLGGFV
jgi:hypothetical protein